MIKLAQQLNPQAHYEIMDCRHISQLNTQFDALMCGFCLPYLNLADALQLLSDMSNLLNHEGLLYLSTTSGDCNHSGYQSSKSSTGAVYVHYHPVQTLIDTLHQNGFTVLKHEQLTHIHNKQETKDEIILARKRL